MKNKNQANNEVRKFNSGFIAKETSNPFDTSSEPKYVPEGEEFGETYGSKRPKWQTPRSAFQKKILTTVGRQYFKDHNERSAVLAIEKSALSLASGLISVYPLEWVDNCIEWASRKRRTGTPIMLMALLNLINDQERRVSFVAEWKRKNPEISLHENVAEEEQKSTSSEFDLPQ